MKKYSYTLTIPKPCSESWQNMSATEKGKFCKSCEKEVIDFSSLSDDQIIKLVEKSNGKLCGRFKNTQLNRSIQASYNLQRQYPLKSLLAGMVVLSLLPSCDTETVVTPSQSITQADSITAYKSLAMLDDTVLFKGRVLNQYDHPVSDAKVSIAGSSSNVPVDASGRFAIPIPDSLLGKDFKMEINSKMHIQFRSLIAAEFALIKEEQIFRLEALVKEESKSNTIQTIKMGEIMVAGNIMVQKECAPLKPMEYFK